MGEEVQDQKRIKKDAEEKERNEILEKADPGMRLFMSWTFKNADSNVAARDATDARVASLGQAVDSQGKQLQDISKRQDAFEARMAVLEGTGSGGDVDVASSAVVGRNIPDVADSNARVVTARFRKKVHFQAPSSPSPSSSSASNAPAMQETSNLLVAYKDFGRQLDQATRNCDYHLRAQIMEQREIIRQAMRDHRQRNKVLNPRGPM